MDFPGKNTGVRFPPPGDLPWPGMESAFPVSPALAGGLFTPEALGKGEFVLLQLI